MVLQLKVIIIIYNLKDETIPIRFFLSPYDLSPTYTNINNKGSVQYYLNLVLLDVEERRYFKQHEITIVRVDKKLNSSITEK